MRELANLSVINVGIWMSEQCSFNTYHDCFRLSVLNGSVKRIINTIYHLRIANLSVNLILPEEKLRCALSGFPCHLVCELKYNLQSRE